MIWNVIDNRERPYRWKCINAIIEPTWHDNSCEDTDHADRWDGELEYEEREGIPLADAVRWADALPFPVTLYLYDQGKGIAGAD